MWELIPSESLTFFAVQKVNASTSSLNGMDLIKAEKYCKVKYSAELMLRDKKKKNRRKEGEEAPEQNIDHRIIFLAQKGDRSR